MQRPYHDHVLAQRGASGRLMGLVLTGALNAVLIFALATGLATRLVKEIPQVIHAQIVPPAPKQVQQVPPPPPNLVQPKVPQVPQPLINIQAPPRPAPTITTVAVPHPIVVAPPKPAPVVQPTPAAGIESTHTRPPYPPLARRLGQQGTVLLQISVGADGRVSDVRVQQSSGSSALDQAAQEWVKNHWRYRAATQNGKPVASTVRAVVKFDLQNAY